MTDADELSALAEAVLFVAGAPLRAEELATIAETTPRAATAALEALAQRLASGGGGLRLQVHDRAWQMVTDPQLGERLAAYASRNEARLSPAALEALAVIAYRQPCTRADVERVRGVDSDYVIRSLMHRRLVAEVGRRDTPGRPILFATTFTFLERFGLTSLEELPVLPVEVAAQVAGDVPANDDARTQGTAPLAGLLPDPDAA